ARLLWEQDVGSSNLSTPTISHNSHACSLILALQYLGNNPPIFLHQPIMNTANFRGNIMAKGQQRKNKEVKKPKQDKKVVVVSGSVIHKPGAVKK
ncbi:MAG TPA: hypothetical protein PLJ70_07175, partial [Methylotenera sp.]|nr:hypothetical protein [Methylotenera sp.]